MSKASKYVPGLGREFHVGADEIDIEGVKKEIAIPTQANSTATDVAKLVTDFNSLLAKLKSAGLMK